MTPFEKLEVLEEFAEYEGTEWGETMMALGQLYRCRSLISEELAEVLDREISNQHEWASENLKLVTEEVTTTHTVVSIVNLEEL